MDILAREEQQTTAMMQAIRSKTKKNVAAILERELDSTISEWKRQLSPVPSLTDILLSDADRTQVMSTR
jgi:hypothetical protein